MVTSDHLKSRNPNYAPASATSSAEARNQGNHGISIVSLAPGQAINLECEAILVFFILSSHVLGSWKAAHKMVSGWNSLNEIYSYR